MDLLETRIKKFNRTIQEDYYHIKFSQTASAEDLVELQSFSDIKIPAELLSIYQKVGSIKNNSDEVFTFWLPEVAYLLKKLKTEGFYNKCLSLGIIDFIKFSWGNDRREFDEISPTELEYLNKNYKCFGWFRHSWGLEEAYYLYFDKYQKFGFIRYHQDEFDNLWTQHLNAMLNNSPAKNDLQTLLIQVIDNLEQEILQY